MMDAQWKGAVIALGTFDGMHPGHRAVIDGAVRLAKAHKTKSMVFTFLNIPKALFQKNIDQLMPPEEKERQMRLRGIDHVVMVEFSEAFSKLSPEEFIRKIVSEYEPMAFVTGEDYRFGCRAMGDVALLKAFGKEMGFKVEVVETVRMVLPDGTQGEKISSTEIRSAIRQDNKMLVDALMNGRIPGADTDADQKA